MSFEAISNLTPFEKAALQCTLGVAVAGLLYAGFLARQVLRADEGNERMREVALAIRQGANAYLKQQFKLISLFVAALAIILFFSTRVDGRFEVQVAAARTVAFICGALFSALVGTLGMNMAVRGSVRVAQAANRSYGEALRIAYRTGTVTGMLTDGLGLLGGTVIFMMYGLKSYEVLLGFGFGACLLALFMRVGGGIFTKAADIGADYVGKLEHNIPEDDPRNAATIADLVGDNVGDCAGMAADIFESYEVTIVAAMILGGAAFGIQGVLFPVLVRAIGVLSSVIGTYAVRGGKNNEDDALQAITFGYFVSSILTVAGFFALCYAYFKGASGGHDMRPAWATFSGILLAIAIHKVSEHFTSAKKEPVKEVTRATGTGHATTILSGLALGFESAAWSAYAIAGAVMAAAMIYFPGSLVEIGYGIALCGVGMLTLTGNNLSMDVFGPVVDNANGIGEMSKMGATARQTLTKLDAIGNTTKAITKGVAIASAVIAAMSLFSSFVEQAAQSWGFLTPAGVPDASRILLSLNTPAVFMGALLGASMPFLFSASLIRAVFRSASEIILEVRHQFHSIPGLLKGKAKPDYARVVTICTRSAEKELEMPGILAVLAPIAVGAALGVESMGAFLGGAILSGQLLAVFMANAGGAWDNAKKLVEDGAMSGKGSEAHRASITGDTVGDPLKDTAGPALNPLTKVMNLVGLLAVPIVVAWERASQGEGMTFRLSVAAVLLMVLIIVSARSRRSAVLKVSSHAADAPDLRNKRR